MTQLELVSFPPPVPSIIITRAIDGKRFITGDSEYMHTMIFNGSKILLYFTKILSIYFKLNLIN